MCNDLVRSRTLKIASARKFFIRGSIEKYRLQLFIFFSKTGPLIRFRLKATVPVNTIYQRECADKYDKWRHYTTNVKYGRRRQRRVDKGKFDEFQNFCRTTPLFSAYSSLRNLGELTKVSPPDQTNLQCPPFSRIFDLRDACVHSCLLSVFFMEKRGEQRSLHLSLFQRFKC